MADINISSGELNDPAIDEVINLEKSLSRSSEGTFVEDVKTPFYMNPMFYYTVAATIGALVVHLIHEPYFDDNAPDNGIPFLSDYLLFGSVAGGVGFCVGLMYGFSNRNMVQMLTCGFGGLGVGLGVTIVTTVVADILFGIIGNIAYEVQGPENMQDEGFPFRGVAFVLFTCGRGLAWAIISLGAGMGLGVILKSKKLLLNGLAGGLVGGMLGGMLFDPVHRFITPDAIDAALSRGIGITSVGLLVGLFIGFFENISKDAWFLMMKGPLTGKQFNLYKSPMVIGSAPKCDIYLFKDPAIEPKHATITKTGNKYVLKDNGSEVGTHVNGAKVTERILQTGDVIAIGEAVLKYEERQMR